MIIYNTKNSVGLGIDMDGMEAKAWTTLTENYRVFSEIATMNAEKRLRATELQNGMDFLKHVEDLREKWKSATEKGAKIDDLAFRTILIASLPESWNTVVVGLYAMTKSKDAIAALMTYWDRLVSQKQKSGILATALQTQSKPRLVCVNPNCQRSGHVIENCYWKGGGKEGLFPPNFQNKGKTPRTLPSNMPMQTATQTTTPAANVAASNTPQTQDQPQVTYTLSTMTVGARELVEDIGTYISRSKTISTYADSGATDHFFVNRKAFSDYEELRTPSKVVQHPRELLSGSLAMER